MTDGTVGAQLSGSAKIIRLGLLIVLFVLLVAQIPPLVDLTVRGVVYENQGITDLGRDLLGVKAVEQGGIPYRTVGDLVSEYGPAEQPLSGPPRLSGWVVHPPLALAGARALLTVFGADAELAGRRLGATAVMALTFAIIAVLRRRKPSWAFPVAIATLVWVPTFTDTIWIQGNALAGLGLLSVAFLDGRGRRIAAQITLGLLVAWKPWLAVFALALPRSSSVVKDIAVVAGTAAVATLAVLPFVGGFEALWVWISEAIPGNAVEARDTPSNLSWTSSLSPGLVTIIYLGAASAVPLIRRRLPRDLWFLLPVWVATALAPFVWDHYWLAVAPVVWLVMSGAQSDLRLPALAWISLAALPVALTRLGLPGLEYRVLPMVLAGASLLLGSALVTGRLGLRWPKRED